MNLDKCDGNYVIECGTREEWETLQTRLEEKGLGFFNEKSTDSIWGRNNLPKCCRPKDGENNWDYKKYYSRYPGYTIVPFEEVKVEVKDSAYFSKNKIVINCKTQGECDRFVKWFHKNTSEKWHGDIFDIYGEETCYNFERPNEVMYCRNSFYIQEDYTIISLEEFFTMVGEPVITEPSVTNKYVYGIRHKETGRMFVGRMGVQSLWEKPGAIKGSFYYKMGKPFDDQDKWELVTYKCEEMA